MAGEFVIASRKFGCLPERATYSASFREPRGIRIACPATARLKPATGELTLASYEAMGGMDRVVHTAVDEVLSADPEERSRELAALQVRSSRGWPPSTPTMTNPCAGSPGMPTCPSPAGR